jgi:hypothetical protein
MIPPTMGVKYVRHLAVKIKLSIYEQSILGGNDTTKER